MHFRVANVTRKEVIAEFGLVDALEAPEPLADDSEVSCLKGLSSWCCGCDKGGPEVFPRMDRI